VLCAAEEAWEEGMEKEKENEDELEFEL